MPGANWDTETDIQTDMVGSRDACASKNLMLVTNGFMDNYGELVTMHQAIDVLCELWLQNSSDMLVWPVTVCVTLWLTPDSHCQLVGDLGLHQEGQDITQTDQKVVGANTPPEGNLYKLTMARKLEGCIIFV